MQLVTAIISPQLCLTELLFQQVRLPSGNSNVPQHPGVEEIFGMILVASKHQQMSFSLLCAMESLYHVAGSGCVASSSLPATVAR